jgi:hypothetical protein
MSFKYNISFNPHISPNIGNFIAEFYALYLLFGMTLNKFMLDLKMEGRTFIINISQEYHD